MGIPLTAMSLRVTDYSRVSTDHLEQKKSLKNQIDYFSEMIKNNKNWTYVEGYVDEGISGTTDYKRSNFMRMIDDARKNKFDLIITKEISRFSRNTLDSIKYTRELLSYGVFVLFVNDNINTALPDSEFRLTIMASMAQDEIRRLSERVKFGMNRAIINGTILGNNMLYGYRKDKITGNLVIVLDEANVIRRLFSLYAINNYSLTKIAKIFNSENCNKKWYVSTLIRMIKNPKYKGYYCGKKSEIIDYMSKKVRIIPEEEWVIYKDNMRIPPIVDSNIWDRANERLKMRNKVLIYHNKYLFSAKIYCSNDNEVYHRRIQCKDDVTWVCASCLSQGRRVCNSPIVRESELYNIFDDIINYFNINIMDILNKLLEMYKNSISSDCELLIRKMVSRQLIRDEVIRLMLKKIVVSLINNNKEDIELNIYLKNVVKKEGFVNKDYEFKRGFNTSRTRRYIVKYRVNIMDLEC